MMFSGVGNVFYDTDKHLSAPEKRLSDRFGLAPDPIGFEKRNPIRSDPTDSDRIGLSRIGLTALLEFTTRW